MFHQKLRRRGAVLLTAALLFLSFPVTVEAEALSVSAEGAVLITADTGTVLWEKNASQRLSMASTTKIMTALLTLEASQEQGDPVVEITEEMVAVEGSSMGLQAGDRISLSNLATGMLLASGNDAANSAALFCCGSLESFAHRMNDRAEKLGMKDTHFVTPSGLDDEEHYSTAYDMALLAREALKNQEFRRFCSSAEYSVEFVCPEKRVSYTNHNRLLRTYQGCIGVKTGFTKKSGRCLVSAAERDGVTLIAVTLNAPDDWDDHRAMLDYGFSAVTSVSFDGSAFTAEVPVVGAESELLPVRGAVGGSLALPSEQAERITCRVLLPAFCYAPVRTGDRVGSLQYLLDGAVLYAVPVLAAEGAETWKPPEKSFPKRVLEKIFQKDRGNQKNGS